MTFQRFDEQLYHSRRREERSTLCLGRNLIVLESVDSTSSRAKELGAERAPHGTVIVAETQTAGRGRFKRAWASPAGGLWFSLVLRPESGDPALPSLSLLAGVSLITVLEAAAGEKLLLGWPNDVVHNGKKLAGILVENVFGNAPLAVVGVGVNVNNAAAELPSEVAAGAVSLREITGAAQSREALLAEFIAEFETGYETIRREEAGKLLKKWEEKLDLTGKSVTLKLDEKNVAGTVVGFGIEGTMTLRLGDGSTVDVPLDRGMLVSAKYAKRL